MLSQFIFKIGQLSTSTKLILKEGFINYTQNKVIQLPNNAIIKGNHIFWLIWNDEKNICEKIKPIKIYCKVKIYFKMIQIITKLDDVFSYTLNTNWLYHFNYNWKV